jgi:hypothetical protein
LRPLARCPLRDLVAIAFGPRQIVPEEFAIVPDVVELHIFGQKGPPG